MTSRPGVELPRAVAVVAAPVRARLDAVLDEHLTAWTAIDPDLEAPLESIRRIVVAGGKRLRPAFCYWGFRAAGGDPDDPRVIDAGAAFELLHAFALIHDDVMDGSNLRRGTTTVHVEFAELHANKAWRGDSERFGVGVAILAGDLASVLADRLLEDAHGDARAVWDQLRLEVNIGQYLDVVTAADGGADLPRARRISRYKSGKYTVERPLHLGASLAGALDRLGPVLSAYGEPLGEAFQLRDDLLGVYGDPAVTGKPVGEDLREGKQTPLLVVAQERAGADHAALLSRIGTPELDEHDVAELRALFDELGARQAIEEAIEALTAEALDALGSAPLEPEVRDALAELARYVGRRHH